MHVQLSFMLGQLVDSDYLHLFAIWSKGTFGIDCLCDGMLSNIFLKLAFVINKAR